MKPWEDGWKRSPNPAAKNRDPRWLDKYPGRPTGLIFDASVFPPCLPIPLLPYRQSRTDASVAGAVMPKYSKYYAWRNYQVKIETFSALRSVNFKRSARYF